VLLGKYFNSIYIPLYPPFKDIIFLGHVTLIVIAVMVLLLARRVDDAGYGFVPNRREWRIGLLHFLYFAPFGTVLAVLFGAAHFIGMAPLWKFGGLFVGFMWTIALSEEFFFWGVLQGWMKDWIVSPRLTMPVVAALFGLVHISFRGFPNWRWELIAATLGWFCGRARQQAGSIRAGMVTHALVFATWQAFFR
jgi:hypothetical protein